ncbi:MAG: hypothetical protein KAJ62_06300, partial [Desulfobacteraceae bacterium]|nr:hypothetical protein [Desulfobacteraceae bacterium]
MFNIPVIKSKDTSHFSTNLLYFSGILFLFIAFIFGFLRITLFPFEIEEDYRIIPNSKISKLISLDHEGFLADILFIQVNLHSGSLMWKPLSIKFDSKWAYATMDVVTDLDPKFYKAYLLSSMGLIHKSEDVRLSEPILKKGMKNFPESWELPFWAGYGYYNHVKDYKKATEYMLMAYNKPGAPKRFLGMMASATQKSGNFDKAAIAMMAMMESTDNKKLKILYGNKMVRMKNFAKIMAAAKEYKAQLMTYPKSIEDLIIKGYLKQIPKDPMN